MLYFYYFEVNDSIHRRTDSVFIPKTIINQTKDEECFDTAYFSCIVLSVIVYLKYIKYPFIDIPISIFFFFCMDIAQGRNYMEETINTQNHDFDDVYKTMKCNHPELFIAVINDALGTHYSSKEPMRSLSQ